MQGIENKIAARIYGTGRGWAFSQMDFADLAPRNTRDWALHRLEKKGTIRRVMRGVYDYPQISTLLGEKLPADIPRVALAVARKFGWKIAPSGDTALNILGISNQVPASYIYMSTGRPCSYRIGNQSLIFKKSMLKEADFAVAESALIVQALRALGKEPLSENDLRKFRNAIDSRKYSRIVRDTKSVTSWIHEHIKKIYSGAN